MCTAFLSERYFFFGIWHDKKNAHKYLRVDENKVFGDSFCCQQNVYFITIYLSCLNVLLQKQHGSIKWVLF